MQFYLINVRPKLHHQKWLENYASKLPVNMMTVPNFLDFTVNAVVLYCNLYILHFEYFCQISSKLILTILSYTVSMLVHFLRHSVDWLIRYLLDIAIATIVKVSTSRDVHVVVSTFQNSFNTDIAW